MYLHANAKLGLAGRVALVRAVEGGCSLRAAAVAFSVSPATVHRWWHRWLDGGRQPQALLDRSSRPHRSPRQLAPELERAICACRPKTGWGRAWSPVRRALRTHTATPLCHIGSTTTTGNGHTAHSATGHPSAAFTTSVG